MIILGGGDRAAAQIFRSTQNHYDCFPMNMVKTLFDNAVKNQIDMLSWNYRWNAVGLKDFKSFVTSVTSPKHIELPGKISGLTWTVNYSVGLSANADQLIVVKDTYNLLDNGVLRYSTLIDATTIPHALPRIGMRLTLGSEFNNITYEGNGPHENYPDRKSGANPGCYTLPIEEMFVPYVVPSEHGGRTDCSWISATNNKGKGILFCATRGETIQFTASKYSMEDLERAERTCDLPMNDELTGVHLNIDHRHAGVGGDNSWEPVIHEMYQLSPQVYHYGIDFCLLDEGCTPGAVATGLISYMTSLDICGKVEKEAA